MLEFQIFRCSTQLIKLGTEHNTWEFTFLCMQHVADESEIMTKDLLNFLHHIHDYFTAEAKAEVQGDKRDAANNIIGCATDDCAEEDDIDDIGFEGVQQCLNEQKT